MLKNLVKTFVAAAVTVAAFALVLYSGSSATSPEILVVAERPTPVKNTNSHEEPSPKNDVKNISEEVETFEEPAEAVTNKPAATLKTASDVAKTPHETVFKTMAIQGGATWGLDIIDGTRDGSYEYVSDGHNVRIYIVDTGVNALHPEFGGRVVDGFDAFGQNLDQTDCNGHGTHIAGIAAGTYFGVAKRATIVPVRVMDCNGVGNTTTLTEGIEWILASHSGGTGIVNMSIGGSLDLDVNAAVQKLVSAGLIVVAAAGNSGVDACLRSPVSANGVIGVGALDKQEVTASFSNWGSCVDISAPGVGINSANADSYNISKQMSGTSQASPFVAGALATYLSGGNQTPESRLYELAKNGALRVEVEQEAPIEPTPEPVLEPEPEPLEPEPLPSPVVDEPILPEYDVNVVDVEDGPMFGLLTWSQISSSNGYKVYRTSPERPTWKVYGAFTANSKTQMLIVTDVGKFARYRVVAIIDSKEVEIGEIIHAPTE